MYLPLNGPDNDTFLNVSKLSDVSKRHTSGPLIHNLNILNDYAYHQLSVHQQPSTLR
jgi:hypothetical protein